jgi:hypothetical protein
MTNHFRGPTSSHSVAFVCLILNSCILKLQTYMIAQNQTYKMKATVWNLDFKIMQSILAIVLHSQNKHEAWCFKVKIKPKVDPDMLSPLHEAPDSKLLGISIHDLWEVLINCNLAKKISKRGNTIDRNGIQQFITNSELTNSVILDIRDKKQPVLRIGIFTKNSLPSDHSTTPLEWKSRKSRRFLSKMPPSNSAMIWQHIVYKKNRRQC